MFYKKTLVLSAVDGGNEKAVLNIEHIGGELVGNLKLYNFKDEPEGVLTLGILDEGNVIKAGLTKTQFMRYSFKLDTIKQPSAFSCGLININKGKATPILHGATNGAMSSEERLAKVAMEMDDKNITVDEIVKTLDDNNIYLEEQEEIEKEIDSAMCENSCGDKCSVCKYRHAFFNNEILKENEESESPASDTFFDGIKEQVDALFKKYPEEEFLSAIIPNSKWVKIDYEDNGEYYVLGLIYEDSSIKYVCYGVPGMWEETPPKDLSGHCQWLPLDNNKPNEFGYWITYQDADNGESVIIDYNVV